MRKRKENSRIKDLRPHQNTGLTKKKIWKNFTRSILFENARQYDEDLLMQEYRKSLAGVRIGSLVTTTSVT